MGWSCKHYRSQAKSTEKTISQRLHPWQCDRALFLSSDTMRIKLTRDRPGLISWSEQPRKQIPELTSLLQFCKRRQWSKSTISFPCFLLWLPCWAQVWETRLASGLSNTEESWCPLTQPTSHLHSTTMARPLTQPIAEAEPTFLREHVPMMAT